ncbi:hypothetical protein GCM10011414_06680 [Croceivirga lutea]|uniref:restriction endonuclease subunit S n=1 Tax=Croceivirga lutea TaxID=1775167 RepID=UPI001983F7FB|nr:restriction endonuclease subunit S [Croceivirga lutea]GGG39888.1 hypothetical protein GCM10011414_06680 [Croceivirga lutea]
MNYKRLGDYIKRISVKNTDGLAEILYGINIDKFFMPSVANVIGTDLTRYKVVSNNQFACNRMHVGRDKRLPIALSDRDYDFIVSPAYDVFEINDVNALLPEYLMMWFTREEFDRNCWFHTDSDVRGKLDWNAFMDMTLPIPSIEKQQLIVDDYNTVTNRIQLNEKINANLEATAQALYKKLVAENQCEEYLLKDLCSFQEGYVNPSQKYPNYFDGNIKWLRANDVNGGFILNTSRTLTEEGFESAGASALLFAPHTIVITKSGTIGRLGILNDYMCGNRAVINIKPKEDNNLPFIFFSLKSSYNELIDLATGSAQRNLYVPILATMKIQVPDEDELTSFYLVSKSILNSIQLQTKENQTLKELQSLLLAKMTQVELKTLSS